MKQPFSNFLFLSSFFLAAFTVSMPVFAAAVDLNVVYSSDSIKSAETMTDAVTSYDLGVGIPIGKRNLFFGVNYGSVTSVLKETKTVKYSSTDMGFKLSGYFARNRLFSSSFTYNLKSTVKFDDGAATELRGNSMKADLGIHYWFSETGSFAAKLYYYSANLPESVTIPSIETVSYARTMIGQSLGLSWVF